MSELPCPCDSGNTYEDCCSPHHKGKCCKTALQLMRSRYSAYAMGLPLYIIETTHPDNDSFKKDRFLWLQEVQDFCSATEFIALKVLSSKEIGHEAWVHFQASLEQDGNEFTLDEKSYFQKEGENWRYLNGEVK
ncbi:MAG: SEC-C domain-containing protein [Chlamydiales bacterium]|nr:SEC-C domain-containing protein [Chlamydiales bacterium]